MAIVVRDGVVRLHWRWEALGSVVRGNVAGNLREDYFHEVLDRYYVSMHKYADFENRK